MNIEAQYEPTLRFRAIVVRATVYRGADLRSGIRESVLLEGSVIEARLPWYVLWVRYGAAAVV